jgi:hypothetical protein
MKQSAFRSQTTEQTELLAWMVRPNTPMMMIVMVMFPLMGYFLHVYFAPHVLVESTLPQRDSVEIVCV